MPVIKTEEDMRQWDAYLRNTLRIAGRKHYDSNLTGRKFRFYPEEGGCPFSGEITALSWTESTVSIEISKKFYGAPAQPITHITFATSWEDRLWRLHHYDQNDKSILRTVAGRLYIEE